MYIWLGHGHGSISYFVIVPEIRTDEVVAALRASWLSVQLTSRVHFCVANNTASTDPSLHRLPVQRRRNTPIGREEFFADGSLLNAAARERYNGFLRGKVLAMLTVMSDMAAHSALDYAVMLDADTAINVTNVERFVGALQGGGNVPIYTGRCLQYAMPTKVSGNSDGSGTIKEQGQLSSTAPRTPNAGTRRYDIDWFIRMRQHAGANLPYPLTIPPSPGGGPGLIFSRGLLTHVRASLPSCAPLAGWMAMGDTIFSGGDSMLTRCLASLGVRCSNEQDLRLDQKGRCPFAHGCKLTTLFRKNPPWFYVAATRYQRKFRKQVARESPMTEELYGLEAPLEETVSFHHVKPSIRSHGFGPDLRCAVRMRSDPGGRAGWWGSACLPHFALLGAPYAGIDSLMRAVYAHPEVVKPAFENLNFFDLRGRAHKLLEAAAASARQGARTSSVWRILLRLYANYFPLVDPRDFRVTGEANSRHFYATVAPVFFSLEHLRLARLVILLRDPAERTMAELERMGSRARHSMGLSDLSSRLARSIEGFLTSALALARRCKVTALYDAFLSGRVMNATAGALRENPMNNLQCTQQVLALSAAKRASWNALGRSWYHLFLRQWLSLRNGNRPLVLFWDDLYPKAEDSLSQVAEFLRLEPAVLKHKSDANVGAGAHLPSFNLSASGHAALRALVADSIMRTDSMLRAAGQRSLPARWHATPRLELAALA